MLRYKVADLNSLLGLYDLSEDEEAVRRITWSPSSPDHNVRIRGLTIRVDTKKP